MDLAAVLRVLWRFRFLVLVGTIAGLAAAFLAYVRVEVRDGSVELEYRAEETWQSEAVLLVTQEGFPWGRSVPQDEPLVRKDGSVVAPPFAKAERFENLAALYATLAQSDAVRSLMLERGPVDGTFTAAPVLATELLARENQPQGRSYEPLPVVRLTAQAATPEAASDIAARQLDAFRTYLEQQQVENRIPERQRVEVTVLEQPREAELVEGRPKAYPALVGFALIGLALVLAFVLDHLMPRPRPRQPAPAQMAIDGHLNSALPPSRQPTPERSER